MSNHIRDTANMIQNSQKRKEKKKELLLDVA
jgi:hypothetical protein